MKIRSLLGLAALLLSALAPAGPAAAQGELRVAIPWTPENLDPTMNLSSIRAQVGVSIFDSLVGRDADNRIVPELAESWRLLDDRTWQFRLRRGVVFHDGEPFNAEAVRFTFQRVLAPEQKSPNRATVSEIVQIDVLDDYTVTLKNEKVDELFDLGRSTTDAARRKKIYSDLARAMVEDATWV
ncbi:MAG: hypothetical protein HYS36_05855, partial [Candidatus Rokubacteria bacterium]|nr:hypothetical protein [Candidatus Rokubacteria bacterium]